MQATSNVNRQAILQEIGEVELRLFELRELLSQTSALKTFYLFRVNPSDQKVIVYAEGEAEATKTLNRRVSKSYGAEGWSLAIKNVRVMTDPREAAGASPGNLLKSLSREEADMFLQDWEADKAGRDIEPRPENTPLSRLEQDIVHYKQFRGMPITRVSRR